MKFFNQIWYYVIIFLPGCMVGPNYQRPHVKLPTIYSEQRQASSIYNLAHWWTFFNDPCLNNLIEEALKNNFDLAIALEKIIESRNIYKMIRANLLPEFDIFGAINSPSFTDVSNINATSASSESSLGEQIFLPTQTSSSLFQIGFDVLWEIDIWGKLRRAKNTAYDQFQAQIEAMRDIYIMLLSDVAQAYIQARSLQRQVDLMEQQIKIDEKLLILTADRFKSGIASEIPDVQQLAALDESKNQLLILKTALKQTLIRIAVLLAKNPEDFSLCSGNHKVPMSSKNLEVGLPSDLLRRRPDIRKAERLLAAATETVGNAIAEWFPSFSLVSFVGYQIKPMGCCIPSASLTWSLGPSSFWRVLTFGRIAYNIEAKKAEQRQALIAYAQSVVDALGDVESWLVGYFNAKEQMEVLQNKLQATTTQRDLTQSLFLCGLDNETDYLNTEKNRIEIEMEYVGIQQSFSTNLVSLYKALGGGW
jgi:NodT family efflux transporter outer membrane factor (OMF) lipoprotein